MKSHLRTTFIALVLFVFLFGIKPAYPRTGAVPGEPLPDPFLSYLIKAQKTLSRLEEEKQHRLEKEREKERNKKLAAAEKLKALREPHTELQKLDISQLTLTAIISGKDRAWAMVRDKAGRGYILKQGTFIGKNGGKVDKVVWEVKKALFGKRYVRKVIIKEPYLYKEQYIKHKSIEMEMAEKEYK
jgi:hypothetical protein